MKPDPPVAHANAFIATRANRLNSEVVVAAAVILEPTVVEPVVRDHVFSRQCLQPLHHIHRQHFASRELALEREELWEPRPEHRGPKHVVEVGLHVPALESLHSQEERSDSITICKAL